MKPTEQYSTFSYYAVQKVALDYVNEILKRYHSIESYWAVLSCGTVYYAEQKSLSLTI